MKEIEFRFWDKVDKDWLVDGIGQENNIYDFAFSPDMNWTFINKKEALERVEVSQYIGIKDIHGKKVFKGDIVKAKTIIYNNCSREEVKEIREFTGEVIWHQYGWHIARKTKSGTRYYDLFLWNIEGEEDDTMEIIGNRWDNPEMAVIE